MRAVINGSASIISRSVASDGTVKLAFRSHDGFVYESCLLYLPYRPFSKVICVSTQIGCPFDCQFCAVGRESFHRNLEADEILNQVRIAIDDEKFNFASSPFEIAAMGTGEPLLALRSLHNALLNCRNDIPTFSSLNLATVGLPRNIAEYAVLSLPGVEKHLQLSLHASDDELRRKIMPRASEFSIRSILAACQDFAQRTNTKVVVNYILIRGVNDSPKEAAKLVDLLDPVYYCVKISALNEIPQAALVPANTEERTAFCHVLRQAGIDARVFTSAGLDIGAGCGQFSNLPQ